MILEGYWDNTWIYLSKYGFSMALVYSPALSKYPGRILEGYLEKYERARNDTENPVWGVTFQYP